MGRVIVAVIGLMLVALIVWGIISVVLINKKIMDSVNKESNSKSFGADINAVAKKLKEME